MTRKKRSALQMKMELLRHTEFAVQPTRLMYKVEISWQPMIRLLDAMQDSGLLMITPPWDALVKRDRKVRYIIQRTERGADILLAYNRLMEMMEAQG